MILKDSSKILFILIALFLSFTAKAFAEDNPGNHNISVTIPEVALIGLKGADNVVLQPSLPTEAGAKLDVTTATYSNIWLNYSSITAKNKKRKVTVSISSGKVPAGLKLMVKASADNGMGNGTVGTPANDLRLNSSEKTLIRNIKSCYTGNGLNKGHNISYYLDFANESKNYKKIVSEESTITITYTISDDN